MVNPLQIVSASQGQSAAEATIALLEQLLAAAQAGEVVNLVAIAWSDPQSPSLYMATTDWVQALGSIRAMEHAAATGWVGA